MFAARRISEPPAPEVLSQLFPRQAAPPPDDWRSPENLGFLVETDTSAPVGALLLTPKKCVAEKVISFRVVFLGAAEFPGSEEVVSTLLTAAGRAAARRGVSRIHVVLHPNQSGWLEVFHRLSHSHGAAFVVSLAYAGERPVGDPSPGLGVVRSATRT